jgi:hypothetical protein
MEAYCFSAGKVAGVQGGTSVMSKAAKSATMFKFSPLRLVFVLQENKLYVLLKESQFLYDLRDYDFDINQPITRGEHGNHLMKDKILKKVKGDINGCLTFWERTLSAKFYAIFIADREMNNLGIRHFIDFTEQMNAWQMKVYHDKPFGNSDMRHFVADFLQRQATLEPIGTAGFSSKGHYYKVPDNSIEESRGK